MIPHGLTERGSKALGAIEQTLTRTGKPWGAQSLMRRRYGWSAAEACRVVATLRERGFIGDDGRPRTFHTRNGVALRRIA